MVLTNCRTIVMTTRHQTTRRSKSIREAVSFQLLLIQEAVRVALVPTLQTRHICSAPPRRRCGTRSRARRAARPRELWVRRSWSGHRPSAAQGLARCRRGFPAGQSDGRGRRDRPRALGEDDVTEQRRTGTVRWWLSSGAAHNGILNKCVSHLFAQRVAAL